MIRTGYKFRCYPSEEQVFFIQRTFGCARLVWNLLLEDAKKNYEHEKKFKYPTPATYKGAFPFLREVDSMALCNAQQHLRAAFSRWFEDRRERKQGKRKGKRRVGFPRFKSKKKAKRSYTTNITGAGNQIRIQDGKLRLPKLGLLNVKFHRRVVGKIKSATVSQTPTGKYFVSILVEQPKPEPVIPDFDNAAGIDMAFAHIGVLSTGERLNHPRWYRVQAKKLGRAQRSLSRKTKGSHSYEKQRKKVARLHEKIANQRRAFLHEISTSLVEEFDVVVVEDINLKAMARKGKRRRWGKSIHDMGFGMFRVFLEYKATRVGKLFVKADRWLASSQLCSCCGYQNRDLKDLSIRTWVCPNCGAHHDRDINAAQNLVIWFRDVWLPMYKNTVATTGIYAGGDLTATSNRNAGSKSSRGSRKSCGLDPQAPSFRVG